MHKGARSSSCDRSLTLSLAGHFARSGTSCCSRPTQRPAPRRRPGCGRRPSARCSTRSVRTASPKARALACTADRSVHSWLNSASRPGWTRMPVAPPRKARLSGCPGSGNPGSVGAVRPAPSRPVAKLPCRSGMYDSYSLSTCRSPRRLALRASACSATAARSGLEGRCASGQGGVAGDGSPYPAEPVQRPILPPVAQERPDAADRQSAGRTPVGEVRAQQRACAAQIVGLGRVGDRDGGRALGVPNVVHTLGGRPGCLALGAQLGDRPLPAAAHRPPPFRTWCGVALEATRTVRLAIPPPSALTGPTKPTKVRTRRSPDADSQAATGSRDQFRSTWVAPSRTTMGPYSFSSRRYSLPPEFGFLYPAHLPRSACDRATPAAWWAM